MNRQQKETVVSDFKKYFDESTAAFLVNYRGVTVESIQSLRKSLREGDAHLKITKARLMKLAVKDSDVSTLDESLKDQIGVVFASNDVAGTAKRLVDFSKGDENLKLVSGFFESRLMSLDEVKMLASLPSRDVLLAKVVQSMQYPLTSFVGLLNMMMIRFVVSLKKIEEKKTDQS